MSDLERELRAALDDRAGRVESDLDGPELRRLAVERAVTRRGRARRAAPVLASAAAVAALGIGAALLTASSDDPRPVQPGGPRPATVSPAVPSTAAAPSTAARQSPSPTVSRLPLRPAVSSRPTAPGRPSVSATDERPRISVPAVPRTPPVRSSEVPRARTTGR